MYSGQGDTELKVIHENTSSTLIWINLFNWLLEPFKGKGHSVVCDSAYMSDTLGMIGTVERGTNILGTCQTNCTGWHFSLNGSNNQLNKLIQTNVVDDVFS